MFPLLGGPKIPAPFQVNSRLKRQLSRSKEGLHYNFGELAKNRMKSFFSSKK